MLTKLLPLLNIRQNEKRLVTNLFLIQFMLGVATAFLNTGSLTLFLSAAPISQLPRVFILSAILVLIFNQIYAYYETHLKPNKLLSLVIGFSAVSLLALWAAIAFFKSPWLIFLLAGWNVLVYMLINYAFWGIAAMLFNVRESKRLFSIVGTGEIPAKIIGYASVSVLAPFIGITNLLWISILAFVGAMYLLNTKGSHFELEAAHHTPSHAVLKAGQQSFTSIVERLFHKRLIFAISLLALLSSIVFSFADYTFLSEIKLKFKEEQQLAFFIAVFFGAGRVLAIFIKLLLSSRVINRLGLTYTLAITPLVLLLINAIAVFYIDSGSAQLYLFGMMVLLMEVLRTTIQDPVFFILFQPLNTHDRLKGHLIAKGYTLPAALLMVGGFLIFYQQEGGISILLISKILIFFLFLWLINIFFIREEYQRTLVSSIEKGYFTGEELFLDNVQVSNILLEKTKSAKAQEVIHALNLLERSKYGNLKKLLLQNMQYNDAAEVRRYAISRIVVNKIEEGLPLIDQQLQTDKMLQPDLLKAKFYLDANGIERWKTEFPNLSDENKKAAMVGLLLKKQEAAAALVKEQLLQLVSADAIEPNKLVLEVITEAEEKNFREVLEILLLHPAPVIHTKAIETTGRVKDLQLFHKMYEAVIRHKAFYAFQRALIFYGDAVFEEKILPRKLASDTAFKHAIKAAAKVKGAQSEAFLLHLFQKEARYRNAVTEALWLKKVKLEGEKVVFEEWLSSRLKEMAIKVNCYHEAGNNDGFYLLQNALASEIGQDVEVLLKAFALIYKKEPINRFIELYKMDDAFKMANAMELLELTIPKKYFLYLSVYIELAKDISKKRYAIDAPQNLPLNGLLLKVVTNTGAEFNNWTRSVAMYLIPKLHAKEVTAQTITSVMDEEDVLLQETGASVLTTLN